MAFEEGAKELPGVLQRPGSLSSMLPAMIGNNITEMGDTLPYVNLAMAMARTSLFLAGFESSLLAPGQLCEVFFKCSWKTKRSHLDRTRYGSHASWSDRTTPAPFGYHWHAHKMQLLSSGLNPGLNHLL